MMYEVGPVRDNGRFVVYTREPAAWLIEEYGAITRRSLPGQYEISDLHYATVSARVAALNAAEQTTTKAAAPRRSASGSCVLCGDPTDRPYYRYCPECYPA